MAFSGALTAIENASSASDALIQNAYDKEVGFALRNKTLFRNLVDVRPHDLSNAGYVVKMQKYADLSRSTSALDETDDPDTVALPATTTVTITLAEWGIPMAASIKFRVSSLSDTDPAVVDILARHQDDTLDYQVQETLRASTNVMRSDVGAVSTQALNALTAGDNFSSAIARQGVVELRDRNVDTRDGEYFLGLIHPRVGLDLRQETGAAGWRQVHDYSGATNIWKGEVGAYEGARWIETNRCYTALDGASSYKVYRGYVIGAQALAEAASIEPHVVLGPEVDPLRRKRTVGWHSLIGWALYRTEAVEKFETTASS